MCSPKAGRGSVERVTRFRGASTEKILASVIGCLKTCVSGEQQIGSGIERTGQSYDVGRKSGSMLRKLRASSAASPISRAWTFIIEILLPKTSFSLLLFLDTR